MYGAIRQKYYSVQFDHPSLDAVDLERYPRFQMMHRIHLAQEDINISIFIRQKPHKILLEVLLFIFLLVCRDQVTISVLSFVFQNSVVQ